MTTPSHEHMTGNHSNDNVTEISPHVSHENITQTPRNGKTNAINVTNNSNSSINPQKTQSIPITSTNVHNNDNNSNSIPVSISKSGFLPAMNLISSNFIDNNILSNNFYENKISPDICNTTACQTAGKLIRDAINSSVDPCDDFYSFACGGWMATHTIPKDKSRYGNFDALDEALQQNVKKELSEPSKKSDSVSVVYASELFKTCTDNGIYCLKIKFFFSIIVVVVIEPDILKDNYLLYSLWPFRRKLLFSLTKYQNSKPHN